MSMLLITLSLFKSFSSLMEVLFVGCFSFWCFPCFACATARKHGECLCLPLLDGFGCIPPITMAMRVSVRNRYGIQGTICNDCLYSTFCGVCAWCQMSREMNVREQNVNLVHNQAK
uniref:Plac8 onzin related protein 5 n=1 Tax=Sinocyclocheilus rhinocerous TaxID=307959 RepID=A0A673I9B8_9TELE